MRPLFLGRLLTFFAVLCLMKAAPVLVNADDFFDKLKKAAQEVQKQRQQQQQQQSQQRQPQQPQPQIHEPSHPQEPQTQQTSAPSKPSQPLMQAQQPSQPSQQQQSQAASQPSYLLAASCFSSTSDVVCAALLRCQARSCLRGWTPGCVWTRRPDQAAT